MKAAIVVTLSEFFERMTLVALGMLGGALFGIGWEAAAALTLASALVTLILITTTREET